MELGLILFVITFIVLAMLEGHAAAPRERGGRKMNQPTMNMPGSADPAALEGHAHSGCKAPSREQRRLRSRCRSLPWRSASSGWSGFCLRRCASASAACRSNCSRRSTPPPNTDGGGLLNAIVGSLMHGRAGHLDRHAGRHSRRHLSGRIRQKGWLASVTRFINDILLSAPSIVIGLFVYASGRREDGALLRLGRRHSRSRCWRSRS